MADVNKTIYDILRGSFLINDDAFKNWRFIVFVVVLMLLMVASSHSADKKVIEIAALSKEIKEMRAQFIDTRTKVMELKLESAIRNRVVDLGLVPSDEPPQKILVTLNKNK